MSVNLGHVNTENPEGNFKQSNNVFAKDNSNRKPETIYYLKNGS